MSSNTMGGKIPAFIILINDRGDTGDGLDGQEDRKERENERDEGSVLSDGTPGRKAPLSEEDGQQFAGSLAVPTPLIHSFVLRHIFFFFAISSACHIFCVLLLPSSFSTSPVIRRCSSLFFRGGDTTQLPRKTLRQFPAANRSL